METALSQCNLNSEVLGYLKNVIEYHFHVILHDVIVTESQNVIDPKTSTIKIV